MQLLPHQEEAVRLIHRKFHGRVLLSDEMGLGKTITALSASKRYKGTLVIICPSYLAHMWQAECQAWLSDSSIQLCRRRDDIDDGADIVICSYDIATFLSWLRAGVCIIDESHMLKDHESQRYCRLLPFLHKTPRVFMLSGSPVPNRPKELFTTIHILRPQHSLGSYYAFCRRYCGLKRTRYGYNCKGCTNTAELRKVLARIMLRRTKEAVLTLPPLVRQIVEFKNASMQHCHALEEQLDETTDEMASQRIISKLFEHTMRAKLPLVSQIARERHERPLIVFAHHAVILDKLQDCFKDERTRRIDGTTSTTQRAVIVRDFQNNDVDVLVASILAAGTGLTLTASNTIVFAELNWSPEILKQAECRIHRIGQRKPAHVYYYIIPGTGSCDELIYSSLQSKQNVVKRLLK